jgi:hypothetical protein
MKVVRLSALRTGSLYPPGNIPGTHFCWRLSRPQGHSAARSLRSPHPRQIRTILGQLQTSISHSNNYRSTLLVLLYGSYSTSALRSFTLSVE